MNIKRRLGLCAGILAVGLGSGHFLQTRAAEAASSREQAAATVTAGAEPTAVMAQGAATPGDETIATLVSLTEEPAAQAPALIASSEVAATATTDCSVDLALALQPRAIIGVSLKAPCHAGERVVLRHAGLAITARTTVKGALFLTLPALTADAQVSVLFPDATTAEATLEVPEAISQRRFAVQWTADDSFQLNAFENGADYGMPGHVWSGSDGRPGTGQARAGGFLMQLGDPRVALPMLTQIYTYPSDPMRQAEIVIEATVTSQTCDRDLLGETIASEAGQVTVTDLMVTMPGCDAVGDILVLKNIAPGPTVTAAN